MKIMKKATRIAQINKYLLDGRETFVNGHFQFFFSYDGPTLSGASVHIISANTKSLIAWIPSITRIRSNQFDKIIDFQYIGFMALSDF